MERNHRSLLGEFSDEFDLFSFYQKLDQMALEAHLVIPKRDGGDWLEAQVLSEARRRGLPLRVLPSSQSMGKQTTRLALAVANIAREGQ